MLDIRLDTLRKAFNKGTVVANDDISITFPAGTTTCLLGPSGCGKTTLMRLIAGLDAPTSGQIFFGDRNVTHLTTRQRNIGMVFQYPVVYRGMNVRENIALPLKEARIAAIERQKRIDEVLTMLNLRDAATAKLHEIDNVTRQKVAVARAVARQSKIILFDEPITNVDITAKLQFKQALKTLFSRLNQTIIYVTHDQTEAMTLADRIALMDKGRIVQYDTPKALYNQPDTRFGGWFLGNPGMNFFQSALHVGDAGTFSSPLFASPILLRGDKRITHPNQIVLGIRPEDVRLSAEEMNDSIRVEIVDKRIVTGGQLLLALKVDQFRFNAKVPSTIGRALQTNCWARLPYDQIRLFDAESGRRIMVQLQPAKHTLVKTT